MGNVVMEATDSQLTSVARSPHCVGIIGRCHASCILDGRVDQGRLDDFRSSGLWYSEEWVPGATIPHADACSGRSDLVEASVGDVAATKRLELVPRVVACSNA